jgi:antitoxin VapB
MPCGALAEAWPQVDPAHKVAISPVHRLELCGMAMYIDVVWINIRRFVMALQIANPAVVAKVERLARATGLTKTAVVERAIDHLSSQTLIAADSGRMAALLAQLDRVPDRADAFDPLQWDSAGLPK